MMDNRLTRYETRALKKIRDWKNPDPGWFGKAAGLLGKPADKLHNLVSRAPGMDLVAEKAFGRLVGSLNDLAHWSVRTERIYREYRDKGCLVYRPEDIIALDLWFVDEMIGRIGTKYKSLAGVEGAAIGAIGLPGIPADIVALVALNQRCVAEYAAYLGFDATQPAERLYALHVLSMASSATRADKKMEMAELDRIAVEVARNKIVRNLEQSVAMNVVKTVARSLASRLTKAKLAQSVPGIGLGIGAGFNAYYTGSICEAAFNLYRERFLIAKHGREAVEAVIGPVDLPRLE